MQRFTKCMRSDHPDYWRVVQELQGCLYQHNGEDERMVIGSLSIGSMNGKKQEEEIIELKDSPKWNRRYYGFMRKLSIPFRVARIEMHKWWNHNKVEGSGSRLHNGCSVFFLVPETLFGMVSKHCGTSPMSVLTCTSRLKQRPV
jgi:hypothetical protein